MIRFYLMVLLTIYLVNCTSTRKLMKQEPNNLSEFTFEKMEGRYHNMPSDSNTYHKLWRILHDTKYGLFYWRSDYLEVVENIEIDYIILKFDEKKRLCIRAMGKQGIIKEVKLRGKVKNNSFSIRKQIVYIPILFLPFPYYYEENKVVLAITDKGNLVLKRRLFSVHHAGPGISNFSHSLIY